MFLDTELEKEKERKRRDILQIFLMITEKGPVIPN